jgi:hypothetical protein
MMASIAPRSDQLNAEDLLTGPVTITIADMARGTAEQPVDIITAEFGPQRPYKPSKTMRRIIVAAWGTNTKTYIGRRITLYRDPDITFGRDKVGGIRISHLSHLDKRLEIALTVTRGKRATFTVDPLTEPQAVTPEAVADFERRIGAASSVQDLDEVARDLKACELGGHRESLTAAWKERRAAIEAAVMKEAVTGELTTP